MISELKVKDQGYETEEIFVAALGWALKELVIVKMEVLVLKVEKNVWGIKILGQQMVGLV